MVDKRAGGDTCDIMEEEFDNTTTATTPTVA
jgi:hypothetical protein